MYHQCPGSVYHIPVTVKVLFIKGNKFKKNIIVNSKMHAFCILPVLVSEKTFTCQICFNIGYRFAEQFIKSSFIRFQLYPTMNIKCKVWPYFMNMLKVIPFNNFLHTYLHPCRYTY